MGLRRALPRGLLAAARGCAPRDIFAALQAPACEGRLWLAGEAVHARYSGYLQGAYLSGEEVGGRVAASLGL